MITAHGNITKLEDVIPTEAQANAPVSSVSPFVIRQEAAVKKFKDTIAKDDSFTESHVTKFLRTMRFIESQRASYCWRDVVILSQDFLQIGSGSLLREIFELYVQTMIDLRKLNVVEGAGDEVLYVIQ